MRSRKHVELRCANCKELFVASAEQLRKLRRGKTSFVCSLFCRGQLAKRAVDKKYNLLPQSLENRARQKLRAAVARKDILKPTRCENCGNVAKIQAHHYAGYEKAYEVQWLCSACHFLADASVRRHLGTKNGNSVLDEVKVAEIKRMLREGASLRALACMFKVSKKAILMIRQNKSWRWVQCF